jgi:hypothetical protein
MKNLIVESYNASEVADKKRIITKRMAAAGGAAVLALGLFNLAGAANIDTAQSPQTAEIDAPQPPEQPESEALNAADVRSLRLGISYDGCIGILNPNFNTPPISTKGLYLTNGSQRWRLPAIIIPPRREVEILPSDYRRGWPSVSKNMRTNFTLQIGDRLQLVDEAGNVIVTAWYDPITDEDGGSGSWYVSVTERVA